MNLRLCLRVPLLVATAVAGSGWVQGALLFDAGAGNGSVARPADSGIGTGVSVTTTTDLTQFAMSLALPNGGNLEYMIWDGTDSTLLFSEVQAVSASGATSYVLSTSFTFTLNAGSTYYFGAIADNNLTVDYMFPATSVTQNGLTSLSSGNTNYASFASPTPSGGGSVTTTLQLFGTDTPEPASLLPVAAGLGLFAWRKRTALMKICHSVDKTI